MRNITCSLLLVFVTQAHSQEQVVSHNTAAQDSMDASVDKFVDLLGKRAHKSWPLHNSDLESTTFGKPGHLSSHIHNPSGVKYSPGVPHMTGGIPSIHAVHRRQDHHHSDKVLRSLHTNAMRRDEGTWGFASGLVGMNRGRSVSQQRNVMMRALPSWQQSMLRIKDPAKSLSFYQEQMGMRLLDKLDFENMGFSLYFLASIPAGEKTPEPGTPEAHSYLWKFPGTTLELTHNYGTEKEEGPVYHPGNEPQEGSKRDGFGHIAFSVGNVYKFCDMLEGVGVQFQKKPNEGRMKGLAFALDPDGYWVELLGRGDEITPACLAQTMLRVKDPKKSIEFYTKYFGMTMLQEGNYGDFSLYYLGSSNYKQGCPVLELTHNHGTENDSDFAHLTGNEDGRKGFGHVGFLVDDVYKTCKELEDGGYELQKAPDAGSMKGLAFARDPDGYWVEVIKRGGYDAQSTPYFFEKK